MLESSQVEFEMNKYVQQEKKERLNNNTLMCLELCIKIVLFIFIYAIVKLL